MSTLTTALTTESKAIVTFEKMVNGRITKLISTQRAVDAMDKYKTPIINAMTDDTRSKTLLKELFVGEGYSAFSHDKEFIIKFKIATAWYSSKRSKPSLYPEDRKMYDEGKQFNADQLKALEEWDPIYEYNPVRDQRSCSCLHWIVWVHFAINLETGNILMIGSTCISKFTPLYQSVCAEINKRFRECRICGHREHIFTMISKCCQECIGGYIGKRTTPCRSCYQFKKMKYGNSICKKCTKAGLHPLEHTIPLYPSDIIAIAEQHRTDQETVKILAELTRALLQPKPAGVSS